MTGSLPPAPVSPAPAGSFPPVPDATADLPPAPVSPAPTGATGGDTGVIPPIGDERLGTLVTHRRYVPYSHAHYAGHLVDGAYALGLFGDVATEVCIRTDGDEGLFASYADVQFLAPMKAGDVLEVTAEVVRVGTRSRDLAFTCTVICRGEPGRSESAAAVLDPPVVAVTARGTVVVP